MEEYLGECDWCAEPLEPPYVSTSEGFRDHEFCHQLRLKAEVFKLRAEIEDLRSHIVSLEDKIDNLQSDADYWRDAHWEDKYER